MTLQELIDKFKAAGFDEIAEKLKKQKDQEVKMKDEIEIQIIKKEVKDEEATDSD